MNAEHHELLERLNAYELDAPGASFPFSAKLGKENNWSPSFTRRAIAEYKRFAFLAVAAGHPVSPSDTIDQVWHLHLTYTENYWKVFCADVLRKPFHHQPASGGVEEHQKFEDWYSKTLDSYRRLFSSEPPSDIWLVPETRGTEKKHFVRVDKGRNWVIPKPRVASLRRKAALVAATGAAFLCSGAIMGAGANPFDWRGPAFLGFYAIAFLVLLALAFWLRRKLSEPDRAGYDDFSKLDPYSVAYLNGGRILTVNTAISNLVNDKFLVLLGKDLSHVDKPGGRTHLLENVLWTSIGHRTVCTVKQARDIAKPVVELIAIDLKEKGLVVADADARKAIGLPLLMIGCLVLFGVIKILIGLSRGRPISFLVTLCAFSVVISLLVLWRRPLRTKHGDALLEQLRARHVRLRNLSRSTSLSSEEFAMGIGLFGMVALADTGLADLRKTLQPQSSSSSCGSSSCGGGGGGCGGGCGGGGCGGCGGS